MKEGDQGTRREQPKTRKENQRPSSQKINVVPKKGRPEEENFVKKQASQ
jgi:hypothetical protein